LRTAAASVPRTAPAAPAAAERILIVEDKDSLRAVLRKTLEAEGFAVDEAPDGRAALERIRRDRFAMVLTDLRLPRADGHSVLKAAVAADPEMPVILMTAYGTIRDAVSAMREGAYDYLEKPVDTDHLLALVRRALEHRTLLSENRLLKERFASDLEFPEILGSSAALTGALDKVRRVAPTDATVLLLGESGSGKELFARAVHHVSGRKSQSFFAINCAAIPENLLESELFGYEKGAFTGASATKRGKFEIADKGTLFLDEIGDLSPGLQGKVLRVLEHKQFERVGGTETRSVDIRLVAATNKDLEALAAAGSFRRDLFFRLSVFPVTVPPLRDRREDIPVLALHFLKRFAAEQKKRAPALPPETLAALSAYPWPGNVRELENAIERALILGEGDRLLPEHLNLPAASRT
jgi:DNA-binding NtrC family response regulator